MWVGCVHERGRSMGGVGLVGCPAMCVIEGSRMLRTRISGIRFAAPPAPPVPDPTRQLIHRATYITPDRPAARTRPVSRIVPLRGHNPAKLARLLPIAARLAPRTRAASPATYHTLATRHNLRTTLPILTTLLRPHTPRTQIKPAQKRMASDDAYAAFLEQANRDPSTGGTHAAATRPNKELKSVDEGEEVPRVLGEATRGKFYVSDADEGFMPVCLRWSGDDLPDEGSFSSLFPSPCPFSCLLCSGFCFPGLLGRRARLLLETRPLPL